jgi:arylsulfatase A-like enzyme
MGMNRSFLILSAVLLVWTSDTIAQRPNIIYIMADDLGYADLSCYGRKDYSTPNLDKLASQGLKFNNAYSAGSLCTPTRVAFMTGRYPARVPIGLREPLVTNAKDSLIGLSADQYSLPILLKEAGYETALIGKWHLGFKPEYSPNANGFDYFFGFHSGAADYVSHRSQAGRASQMRENEKQILIKGYLTDVFKEKVISFLKQPHSKPYFLSIQFNAPHWPWQGPKDPAYPDTMNLTAGGTKEIYAAMVRQLDDAVGSIINELDKQQASNTIVIFTSDNGGEKFSDMGNLSGMKFLLWEGGIKVPAFVRWPGKIKPGTTDQVVITMDWTATIASIADAKPRFPFDGENLMPLFMGQQPGHDRTFYWRTFQRRDQKAIRDGNWKWIKEPKGEFLFDLSKDPGEKNDLKEKEPAKFEALKKKFEAWEATVLKPVALGG